MTSQSEVRAQASRPADSRRVGLVDEFLNRRVDRRQFLARAAMIGLSAPAATALLAACGSGWSTAAPASPATTSTPNPPTKTLSWRPSADVENVDPAILPGLEDPTYAQIFFETLITYRPGTTERVNCLAETFEESPDGKQFHFTLKQGIPFQKGYGEVQASDVKYSFERIAGLTKPNLHSPYQGDWAALETVKVEGKYSGTIIMKEVFAPTVSATLSGAGVASGMVLPQKAIEKLGKKFGTNPVGTGPYEWTSWTPGQKLVMTKFPDYGGANKAYANKFLFEEIDAIPISSDDTAYAALGDAARSTTARWGPRRSSKPSRTRRSRCISTPSGLLLLARDERDRAPAHQHLAPQGHSLGDRRARDHQGRLQRPVHPDERHHPEVAGDRLLGRRARVQPEHPSREVLPAQERSDERRC